MPTRSPRRPSSRRLLAGIAVLLVLATLIFIGRTVPFDRSVTALRNWVGDRGVGGIVVFGLAYAIAALLFVPGAPLSLTAGAVFGPVTGVAVVSVAALAADVAAFLIARYLARDRIVMLARRHPKFGAIDRAIQEGGWKIVALLRLSPTVPYSASNYLYGLTGIRFVPYMLASWVFSFPGTVLYVSFGYAGTETIGGSARTLDEWVLGGLGLGATLGAAVFVARLARRALAEQAAVTAGD